MIELFRDIGFAVVVWLIDAAFWITDLIGVT